MSDIYLKLAAAAAAVGYLSLYNEVHREYQHKLHQKYERKLHDKSLTPGVAQGLTPAEAQEVVHLALAWDMPFLMTMALEFALFQMYAVPSISKLLLATRELASRETVSKRVADVPTWATCPINGYFPRTAKEHSETIDPRAVLSLARDNWLHSKYNISWAEQYGWRSFSDVEKHAWFVYWVEIGKRMNIKDIPPTFEALSEWRDNYEKEHMKPAPSNAKVAKFTADELLRVMVCLMSERVRIAMMEEAQPWYMHAATLGALRALAFWNKHFMLPRWKMTSLVEIDMPRVDPNTGKVQRMHPLVFQSRPWYMPEPDGVVSGIVTKLALFFGVVREFPPGPQFESEGYHIQEMGHEEIEKKATSGLPGCPIPKVYRMGVMKEG
ncbi:hypothetical protein K525DRAFT_290264 [Schizophyllum commune Loenen D]|nr:hypothetical protein K525DRAFT_290264 [Schizophyllum commune Loenen D]